MLLLAPLVGGVVEVVFIGAVDAATGGAAELFIGAGGEVATTAAGGLFIGAVVEVGVAVGCLVASELRGKKKKNFCL